MMTSLDLVGLAPFALLGLDERRRVSAANPEAQAMLGQSERAMYRKPLSEILFHDSPVFALMDKALSLKGDVTAHGVLRQRVPACTEPACSICGFDLCRMVVLLSP